MKGLRFHSLHIVFLLLIVLVTVAYAVAQPGTAKEKVLFSFPASSNLGNTPNSTLISDGAGDLYGVTQSGGLGSGAVYELSPTAQGGWTAKSIYVFPPNVLYPGALAMDSSGNLYGTEFNGGAAICTDGYADYACGAVFELSPDGSGGWSEQIIWNGSQTGGWGLSSLALGLDGNLYGTTTYSDMYYGGTVFELEHSGGKWNETVLRAFGQPGTDDGVEAQGPLLFDESGNIYGYTALGGVGGGGTVFELKKTDSGWEIINLFQLDSFRGETTGYNPSALVFDTAGNLYGGTLGFDFQGDNSVAFELTPTSNGAWQEIVLETFVTYGPGGYGVNALVFDAAGNLFGTAGWGGGSGGGGSEGDGVVFQLTRSDTGTWSEVMLHSFPGKIGDGEYPAGLLPDSKGNLYGTTVGGGRAGVGTVFEITP